MKLEQDELDNFVWYRVGKILFIIFFILALWMAQSLAFKDAGNYYYEYYCVDNPQVSVYDYHLENTLEYEAKYSGWGSEYNAKLLVEVLSKCDADGGSATQMIEKAVDEGLSYVEIYTFLESYAAENNLDLSYDKRYVPYMLWYHYILVASVVFLEVSFAFWIVILIVRYILTGQLRKNKHEK